MSIKERLLAALDTSLDEVSEEILIDILLEQLHRVKAELDAARAQALNEASKAHNAQKQAADEYRRMRSDPLYAISGDFYFTDGIGGPIFIVSVGGAHNIRMFKREGCIGYAMRQLSLEDFMERSK